MKKTIILIGFLASSCANFAETGENHQQQNNKPYPPDRENINHLEEGNNFNPCLSKDVRSVTIDGKEYIIDFFSYCDPYPLDKGRPPEKEILLEEEITHHEDELSPQYLDSP